MKYPLKTCKMDAVSFHIEGARSRLSQEVDDAKTKRVIDALMAENQSAHQRVFQQVELYESTNIRDDLLRKAAVHYHAA